MSKNIQILILSCVLFMHLIETTFGNYCDSNNVVNQAFNLGTGIYLGQGSKSIWKFNPDIRRTIDRKLELQTIFGENSFNWIDTAFTLDFDDCHTNIRSDRYCEAVNKAKGLIFVIGKRIGIPDGQRKYGYRTYRFSERQDGSGRYLIQNDDDINIGWNLRGSDHLFGSFWVQKSGELYYESSVFVKSRNELIVSVFDTTTFSDSNHLMSKKLGEDGQWSPQWTQLAVTGFRGMFDINDRVFGFDKRNTVFEFKWSDDQNISFEPISNLRELVNCFGNSSLWTENENTSPQGLDPLELYTYTTKTTTSTSPPTAATSTESSNNSSTDGWVEEKEEENEIHIKTQTINYETNRPEVELLSTENSTPPQPEMNQKLADVSEDDGEDESSDWSALFVVAILLLIIVIVIALIIIVRYKSKSRIVYLNSKSNDSKSAEIPLNNNDKSLNAKEV